jgi:hypothetical protein
MKRKVVDQGGGDQGSPRKKAKAHKALRAAAGLPSVLEEIVFAYAAPTTIEFWRDGPLMRAVREGADFADTHSFVFKHVVLSDNKSALYDAFLHVVDRECASVGDTLAAAVASGQPQAVVDAWVNWWDENLLMSGRLCDVFRLLDRSIASVPREFPASPHFPRRSTLAERMGNVCQRLIVVPYADSVEAAAAAVTRTRSVAKRVQRAALIAEEVRNMAGSAAIAE